MTQPQWETEDNSPGVGLYVRDTDGEPHILAAVDDNGTGWFCMACPVQGKLSHEIREHVVEHLKSHQI